jgi:hypothetical protein
MLRIRYKEHPTKEDCVVSINEYVSKRTGARYRIVIDYKAMTFAVRNERSKEFIFKSKQYGNKNVLRRNARAKLADLGVEVGRESRNRCFGRCEKGFNQSKWLEERKSNEKN